MDDESAANDEALADNPGSRRRRLWRRAGDESGLVTTEMVVITPVFLVMVLLPIHVALWWHAKQAVDLAVEEALDAAQIEGASEADGVAGANAVLSQTGNVDNVNISVTIAGDLVTVVITGRSRFRVVPGNWGVEGQAVGRVERFIGEPER